MVLFSQVIDSDQHNWFSYVHSFFSELYGYRLDWCGYMDLLDWIKKDCTQYHLNVAVPSPEKFSSDDVEEYPGEIHYSSSRIVLNLHRRFNWCSTLLYCWIDRGEKIMFGLWIGGSILATLSTFQQVLLTWPFPGTFQQIFVYP